ncbi:hypothetical protein KQI68_01190 [Peptoniphilus sp. MSJ-1]|uniref:Uncharacterized protein n=1 Tax=Peptoniphilus ovalis TaxID=2841503 RepID=A0ABS6FGQ7_9FIRM|nr:hypothetical protein [Peptoniphilus ovalis]MBU5668446.1 hypothetical protein [Peptoniphilus ovalis]
MLLLFININVFAEESNSGNSTDSSIVSSPTEVEGTSENEVDKNIVAETEETSGVNETEYAADSHPDNNESDLLKDYGENHDVVEVNSEKPKSEEVPATTAEGEGTETSVENPENKPDDKNPEINTVSETENPKTEETKKNKNQVETSEDLKKLDEKIKNESDANKKKELQKEYNEKYLSEVEASGKEKLDEKILERFTDEERTKQFYEIQAKKKELAEKKEKGNLTQKDIDEYNKMLGEFDPPRLLNENEKTALDKFNKSIYIPGLDNASDEWNKKFEAYEKAKKDLENALNPENKSLDPEELKKLEDDFYKLQDAIQKGIKNGDVKAKFTKGEPEVNVFPLDFIGGLGNKIETEKIYIPDNTPINLLVQVNKDEDNKEFTFTITPDTPEKIGTEVPEADVKNLVFLNGNPANLTKNKDGSYSFTTNVEFGIAQLRFNMPGFKGPFHSGFRLKMKAGETEASKEFLITKKGYEDEANIAGPGSKEIKNAPEIDAGSTENSIVNSDTEKVIDFFGYLKKSNTYIDKVTFNSGNGESLPLSSVEITFTLPEFNGNKAEFINKSGLNYYKNTDGTYTLKLDTKTLGGKLTKDKDGKLFLDGKELTKENITDVILENGNKKVYIDEKGNSHNVEVNEVLEGGDYKVEGGKLDKNANGNYSEVGEFGKEIQDENFGKVRKLEKDGTTYILKGNKLISYTNEYKVFDGHVSNKDDKADSSVTSTVAGNQVTIVDGDKTSYGGTIIEDGIYDSNKKYFKKDGYTGFESALIDNGKRVDINYDEKDVVVDEKTKTKTVTIDGKTYKLVENAVFDKNGYIISNLEYKPGPTLVDKFGRLQNDITVTGNGETYKFTKTTKYKDSEGNEKVDTQKQTSGENIKVDSKARQIFVNNKNYVVDPSTGYEAIKGKYYYNGTKFVPADEKNIKKDKFFENLKETTLEKIIKEFYKDGDKEVNLENKTTLKGNKDDYFVSDGKTYVKKSDANGEYYVNVDDNLDVLSEKEIVKIVQTLGKDKNAKTLITDETSIFDAFRNAKFGLRFPGFLAGKDIVYNLKADVKAKYPAPVFNTETKKWEIKEISIFKDDKGKAAETKTVNKYFTLKNTKSTSSMFFKNKPEELGKIPDINFFNIFYRDGSDRDRDAYILNLLKITEEEKAKEENKKKVELLNLLQKELGRLYNGAKFELNKNKDGFVIKRDNKTINIDRSLLWEIGFTNNGGGIFPEDPDSTIIIEDHNMDNRLIYDEIIINDTKDKWEKAKKEFEDKEENKDKKFGNDEYFFLDQIDNIRFGVNPNYFDNRFVPLGQGFVITVEDIKTALNGNGEIGKDGDKFKIKVTRDAEKGQIRIKVLNAFYKKLENNKFESPVQKAYQDKINDAIKAADNLNANSKQDLIDSFATVVDKIHSSTTTTCYGKVTEKFNELISKIKDDDKDKSKKLTSIKDSLIKEIAKLKLGYLDNSKKEYKNDDMRFNAIRIELKPGTQIGGAMDNSKTKKLGITSVLNPMIDIPYTDEFGNILTNKDKYLNEEIENILKNGIGEGENKKSYTKADLKVEEKYREIYEEAYKRVNDKISNEEIEIKDLAADSNDNYRKYQPVAGSSLDFKDLSVNDKAIKNNAGKDINGFFDSKGNSIENKIKDKDLKETNAYKNLSNQEIDLSAYYMSKDGYNRKFYENFAAYKLAKEGQGPGIFKDESNWKKTICYEGLGKCIEIAGKDSNVDKTPAQDAAENSGAANSKFELTYEPSTVGPEEEKPKVDKDSNKNKIDLSKEDEDKKVDFKIDITVDKLTKDQKQIAEAMKSENNKDKQKDLLEGYNENGFYEYKNGLIIDFLPDVFELKNGETTITLNVDKVKLMANGANASFNEEGKFEEFEKNIKYLYVEDINEYLKTLPKDKAEVLKKAIDQAIAEKRIKENSKQQAVLAWLPTFEAPHGSSNQFTFKLENLNVNIKKFKEYADPRNLGQIYKNHAAFGNSASFLFDDKPVRITDGHKGDVNKYLQLLDEKGNVLNKEEADGWFKGSAEIKFGDKFNYKISIRRDSGIVDTGIADTSYKEWSLDDLFPSKRNNTFKGLKSVLRDFVIAPDGFEVEYLINGEYKKQSEITKDDLVKVTGIKMKAGKAGFADKTTQEFILPMMIPELDAKIENGKVIYIGIDGEKHELGNADEFFNLKDLVNKDKELYAENSVKDSNTVTIYLEKERFIKLYKEFVEADGKEIKKDRPEVKFDIYQIIKINGKEERIKLKEQLTLNEANNFVDKVNHLPLFKKVTTFDENGKAKVELIEYSYEVSEVPVEGYEGKVFKFDSSDELGFVLKAQNTKKPNNPPDTPENPPEEPNTPPGNPPEEPNTPPGNPPEEPNTPPDTPDEPGKPEEPVTPNVPEKPENPDKPGIPNKPDNPNEVPKTGIEDNFGLMLLSGAVLVLLIAYRKRFAK